MKFTDIRSLVRILWKNTEIGLPRKWSYRILAALVAGGILLPCCVTVGFMSDVMTQALIEVGNPAAGILFELQVLSAFSMIFGILVVFSVLYFSSDREHFVTLPIPAGKLMMAKFVYAYLAESAMEFAVIASAFAGYFTAVKESPGSNVKLLPVGILAGVLGTFLIPLVPMIYCAVISILLMAFLKNVRSERTLYRLSGIVLLGFVVLFLYSLRGIGEVNIENYVEVLGGGKDLFLGTMNVIFFPVPWLMRAVVQGSTGWLALYLLVNLLLLGGLYGFGGIFYREGLYTAAALGNAQKAAGKYKNARRHSLFSACLVKEIKVLVRTRAFANNCVYVNLIWPAGAFVFFHFAKSNGSIAEFIMFYHMGKERADLTVTLAMLSVAFVATAMNSVASTAFTREGRHLSLLKFIPVPYRTQILAKAAASTLFTYPPLLLMEAIIGWYVDVPFGMNVFYAVLMIAAHVIAVATGLLMDSVAPYATWDDEYSALRGNVNSFFNMAVMMLSALFVVGISLLLYEYFKWPLKAYYGVLAIWLVGTAIGITLVGMDRVAENLEKL